ncbi:hypothetical protein C8J57DRAFT_1633345 [Mycena rebaudengoi]|nr:hypothetical protein C8J57DRAFT_1633345 [Mycena rebaudengoi]
MDLEAAYATPIFPRPASPTSSSLSTQVFGAFCSSVNIPYFAISGAFWELVRHGPSSLVVAGCLCAGSDTSSPLASPCRQSSTIGTFPAIPETRWIQAGRRAASGPFIYARSATGDADLPILTAVSWHSTTRGLASGSTVNEMPPRYSAFSGFTLDTTPRAPWAPLDPRIPPTSSSSSLLLTGRQRGGLADTTTDCTAVCGHAFAHSRRCSACAPGMRAFGDGDHRLVGGIRSSRRPTDPAPARLTVAAHPDFF